MQFVVFLKLLVVFKDLTAILLAFDCRSLFGFSDILF